MSKKIEICPCGQGQAYIHCCGRFIDDGEIAEAAEQLMRSRYTAYVLGKQDYITKTQKGPAAKTTVSQPDTSPLNWLKLEVVATKKHPSDRNQAFVEFKAYFEQNGLQHCLHEKSKFKKIQGSWYYFSGKQFPHQD